MKKLIVIFWFTVMVFMAGVHTSHAAAFDVAAGIAKLSGDTTYRIGYPVKLGNSIVEDGYFPFSQLEFPLDVYMLSLEGSVEFSERWQASLAIQKNVTDDAGEMEDSDWITESDPTRLDIFSTSNTELDATIWDINFGYEVYRAPRFSFTVGGGYLHQNFDFECSIISQYSPSGLTGYDYVGDGSVSSIYEITYAIPYVEFGIQSNLTDKFSLEASIGYSPFLTVEDEDQHLLRNKVNRGDLEGDPLLFSLEACYDIFTNWFLTFGLDHIKIETDKGDMDAYFYGEYDHTVTEEIESTQTSTMVKIVYEFK